MATVKQKRVAQLIIENSTLDKPLNGGQMLEKVGYSKSMQTAKVNDVLESEGVQEALEEYGFTLDNAKRVVTEIMLNSDVSPGDRLRATDQVFKVKDGYAATKNVNVNLDVTSELKEKSRQAIKQFLDDRGNTR